MRSILLACVGAWAACLVATTQAQQVTIELQLDGKAVQGTPLAWSDANVMLLGRDGFLLNFEPARATAFSKVSDSFQSYSQSELRGQLMTEFGRRFEVSGTGNYLVVHPAGERDLWASRFEELHRSFRHYFSARGLSLQPPAFPLVAVVFPNQQEYLRYVAQSGDRLTPGTLGYYSPTSNRVLMFDLTRGAESDSGNWHINAETIIHEAAHQTAFNTGVHSRYSPPPRWIIEGLGTLFEAPGVWNSRSFPQQRDRWNTHRFEAFRRYVATHRPVGSLAPFVSSDRLFQSDPEAAYAEAWALTFFLSETQPRQYVELLKQTAARPSFTDYRSPERLRDFTAIFGDDLRMLEVRFLRFIDGLQ